MQYVPIPYARLPLICLHGISIFRRSCHFFASWFLVFFQCYCDILYCEYIQYSSCFLPDMFLVSILSGLGSCIRILIIYCINIWGTFLDQYQYMNIQYEYYIEYIDQYLEYILQILHNMMLNMNIIISIYIDSILCL